MKRQRDIPRRHRQLGSNGNPVNYLQDAFAGCEHAVPILGVVLERKSCEFCPGQFLRFVGSDQKYCLACKRKLKGSRPTADVKHLPKIRIM